MSNFEPCTLDEVREALSFIDPNNRDDWIRLGGGIFNEFGDSGKQVWIDWSMGYDKYKASAANATWRSFKSVGSKNTARINSVFFMARENGYRSVTVERTDEQRAALKNQWIQRQREREAQEELEASRIEKMHLTVSDACLKLQELLSDSGSSPYLSKKKVKSYGLYFCERSIVIATDEEAGTVDLITGRERIAAFFKIEKEKRPHFLMIKKGVIAMPLVDVNGRLWSMQFIFQDGGKQFSKGGRVRGCFHLIGEQNPRAPLCFTEGYATAASIYEATGYPFVVAMNCHNLRDVAVSFREHYPALDLLICGDNDHATQGNPGRTKAIEVAGLVGARVVFPVFEELTQA